MGCVAYLGHVYSAFQFYHGWSHASAFEETARQTRETVGWEVGEGLFVSYFFTLVWLADVIWWWLAGAENYLSQVPRLHNCLARVFLLHRVQRNSRVRVGRSALAGTGLVRGTDSPVVDHRKKKA